MRNPVNWIIWLTPVVALGLAVWFVVFVFVAPGPAQPPPAPSIGLTPTPAPLESD